MTMMHPSRSPLMTSTMTRIRAQGRNLRRQDWMRHTLLSWTAGAAVWQRLRRQCLTVLMRSGRALGQLRGQ